MAKYGKSASKRVKSAMRRRKKGTLKSGSGGRVKSRKQAIAIGLNEARRKGAKVPRKSSREADQAGNDPDAGRSSRPHPLRGRRARAHRAGRGAAGLRAREAQLAADRDGQRRPHRSDGAARQEVPGRAAYAYDQYDACLEQVDAVYIALPNSMHAEYTIRAARAGVHVLCEKPMAVTVEECRR